MCTDTARPLCTRWCSWTVRWARTRRRRAAAASLPNSITIAQPRSSVFVRGMFRSPRPEAEVRALRDQALRMPLAASLSLFPSSVPREHWRRIARRIPVPLLYVVTPQLAGQAENLRRARPATRVEVFEEAGHALFADDPERFNRLLESLLAASANR